MADNTINVKQKFVYNRIPNQNLQYANQLSIKDWNSIINILCTQANDTTEYLQKLHMWLVGYNNTSTEAIINNNSLYNYIKNMYTKDETYSKEEVKNLVNELNENFTSTIMDKISEKQDYINSIEVFTNNDSVFIDSEWDSEIQGMYNHPNNYRVAYHDIDFYETNITYYLNFVKKTQPNIFVYSNGVHTITITIENNDEEYSWLASLKTKETYSIEEIEEKINNATGIYNLGDFENTNKMIYSVFKHLFNLSNNKICMANVDGEISYFFKLSDTTDSGKIFWLNGENQVYFIESDNFSEYEDFSYIFVEETYVKKDELESRIKQELTALINNAPETLDTIGELAAAFEGNKDLLNILNDAITNKDNKKTYINFELYDNDTIEPYNNTNLKEMYYSILSNPTEYLVQLYYSLGDTTKTYVLYYTNTIVSNDGYRTTINFNNDIHNVDLLYEEDEDTGETNYFYTYFKKETYSKEETHNLIDIKLDETEYVDVLCNHEIEITGQGENDCNLAIEDQSIVINKIQGQTKRLSDNYIRTTDRTQNDSGITCTTLNGVLTLNGTATAGVSFYPFTSHINKLIPVGKPLTFFAEVLGGTINDGGYFEINVWKSENGNQLQLKQANQIITKALSETTTTIALYIPNGTTFTNYQIRFQCYEGTYTIDNMPTFKPYNSNLGHSKANLLSTTPDGVEPYEEDRMDIDIELGVGSYIDNINGKVHQKTKNSIISLTGSEGWTLGTTYANVQRFDLSFDGSDGYYTNSSGNAYRGNGASNVEWIHDSGFADVKKLSMCFNASLTTLYVLVPLSANITTLADFKTWLSKLNEYGYPIQFTYESANEIIENINLPLGYQVWKNGYQYQNVVSGYVPYILHKQYGISLKSQVLNNIEIDRQQQKQINDIKEKQKGILILANEILVDSSNYLAILSQIHNLLKNSGYTVFAICVYQSCDIGDSGSGSGVFVKNLDGHCIASDSGNFIVNMRISDNEISIRMTNGTDTRDIHYNASNGTGVFEDGIDEFSFQKIIGLH